MVPNDQQRTNVGATDTLVVRQAITAQQMKTQELLVSGPTIFQGTTTFENNMIFRGTTETLTVTTLNSTTGNFTTLTTNTLNVTSGITTVDLTAIDIVATSMTTVNLLANDMKTNTFRASSALLTDTLNQLTMGTAQTITLSAPTPASSRVYTLPDVLVDANFIMSEGNQTINGTKTFTTAPVFPGGLAFSALTLTNTSNQLTMGTGQTITMNAPTPAASRTYTTPDVGADAAFVMTEGAQTINGAKTFTSAIIDTVAINQFVLGSGNTVTINASAPAASRVYTMPDVLANALFILSEGAQTLNGAKTFSTQITINPTTNQLVLGVTNTTTINSVAPSASRTYTIPDAGADTSFVMAAGTQTVAGAKTFSTQITINPTTNQLVLGTAQTITLTAPTPAASRTYTMQDVLASANFIMSEGAQTINGIKTFTSAPVFPALSFASLTLTNTTNQLTLGTTNTTTISSVAPAASRTYTIPDALTNASFILSELAQTLNGVKTFSSGIPITATTNQLVLGTTNTTTITSPAPGASRTYTIPDAGGAASFVMTASSQTIAGTKTFSSAVVINPTTNQLVLGVTNTTTINSTAPSASRVYTIPDAGADTNFVMAAGTQTVAGAKTFSTQVVINPTTNQLVLGVTNTTTINSTAPSASRTYTIPDAGGAASFVMTAGTQTISGAKTFDNATLAHTLSNAGADVTTSTTNSDNTNGASHSVYAVVTGGASGGDPKVTFNTGVNTYAMGIDNSDSDSFVRCVGTALGTTNYERVDTSGRLTYPSQPLFISSKSGDSTNATGAGANFTIVFNTEHKDVGGVYNNATGTFTAPVAGVYWFECNCLVRAISAAMTQGFLKLVVNATDRLTVQTNTANLRDSANTTTMLMARMTELAANDTVIAVVCLVNGAGNTATVGGDANQTAYFSGRLVC